MKNNKKGFTLIELLAVIVILAVIALIATPMVMDAVSTAKRGAAKASAYGFISAAEFSMAQMTTTMPTAITATTSIPVKGTKPSTVALSVSNGVINGGSMVFADGYTAAVDSSGVVTVTGN